MFCPKCGKDAGEARFCPGCGATLGGDAPLASNSSNSTGLAENMAGLLSYLVGWITGIIFIIIDKRPFVRFHAMQSIITFGALTVLNFLLGFLHNILPFSLWRIIRPLNTLISLAGLVLWVLLMVKSYQGQYFKLPVAGNMGEQWAGPSSNLKG